MYRSLFFPKEAQLEQVGNCLQECGRVGHSHTFGKGPAPAAGNRFCIPNISNTAVLDAHVCMAKAEVVR